ncbi:MAG: hypothetical protein RIR95_160 [Pseudomonadota bacterium]
MTKVFTPETALALEKGLMGWAMHQGPAMWHEIAKGVDFNNPRATIDLLMTAEWITHQKECDRATALLFLARAVEAGFDKGQANPAMHPEAAVAFTHSLARAISAHQFPIAQFGLTKDEQTLAQTCFGADGPLQLGTEALNTGIAAHNPPFAFYQTRPYRNKKAHLRVA